MKTLIDQTNILIRKINAGNKQLTVKHQGQRSKQSCLPG